jgi:Ca2+-binding EF-hand superfamily protein
VLDNIFANYDKDNSGTMDIKELSNFIQDMNKAVHGKEMTLQELQKEIKKIDTSNDNVITKQELA